MSERRGDEAWHAAAREQLDEMRAARRLEQAPDAVRDRLLGRVRELARTDAGRAPRPLRVIESQTFEKRRGAGSDGDGLNARSADRERALLPVKDTWPWDDAPLPSKLLAEPGLLVAQTRPLLARVGGAALMVGLVVVVIADVRRPTQTRSDATFGVEPATDTDPSGGMGAAPLAARGSERRTVHDPSLTAGQPATAVVRSVSAAHSASEALAAHAAAGEVAASANAERSVDLAFAIERALRVEREFRAAAARRVVDAREPASGPMRAASAPSDLGPDAADLSIAQQLGDELRLPFAPTSPWLSPSSALQAIRAVAMPYLEHESSYPLGTTIVARGNVRSERGRSLIRNGDFSHGDTMWSVRNWQGYGDSSVAAYYSVRAGALCTTLDRNQEVLGGWPWDDRRLSPSSFELERGKRYRLSLRAWSSGPEVVDLVVKVGHQTEPYTPSLVAKVSVRPEPNLFDIDFVAEGRDTRAGLAFIAASPGQPVQSELCIDDVALRLVGDASAH